METFSALLAICAGNSPVTDEFPAQRPATLSFDVFFDLRLTKWLSKQWWRWWFETPTRSLWRHCNGNQVVRYNTSQQNKELISVLNLKLLQIKIGQPLCVHGATSNGHTSQQLPQLRKSQQRESWWRHQMETFSALLAICAVSGEFPTQRPVTRSFDVFSDLRLNKRLSKQWWCWWFETLSRPLWRHRSDWQFPKSYIQSPWYLRWSSSWADPYTILANFPSIQTMRIAMRATQSCHRLSFFLALTNDLCGDLAYWFLPGASFGIQVSVQIIMACVIRTNVGILLFEPLKQSSMKFKMDIIHFHSTKCIWKCRMRNCVHFVSVSL